MVKKKKEIQFLSVRLDKDMMEHLESKSESRRVSVSDVVRELILRDMKSVETGN